MEARLRMCPVAVVGAMVRHRVIPTEGINVLSLSQVLQEGWKFLKPSLNSNKLAVISPYLVY